MYSGDEGFDNLEIGDVTKAAAVVNIYTDSVRDFLKTWAAKPDITYKKKIISLCINGYDIDHEGSVERQHTELVLRQVRAKVDELTKHDSKDSAFYRGNFTVQCTGS